MYSSLTTPVAFQACYSCTNYPNYVSSIVTELYGGGVAALDPVRAASLNQQQLVANQIQQTKEKAI